MRIKITKRFLCTLMGDILDILPHLIELGLDAVNSQVFCMSLKNLKQFKGQITFWGEIDRQNLLPYGTLQDIEDAVKSVRKTCGRMAVVLPNANLVLDQILTMYIRFLKRGTKLYKNLRKI